MNKNKFFEKVGKLTFSTLLTWLLVTWVVIAAGSWDSLQNWDKVTEPIWNNMVAEIKNKVNFSDLSQFYTKTESDDKFLTEVNIPTIVMDMWTFQWSSWLSRKVTKPTCLDWYTPKIQVNLDWFETVWDVNWDDMIWTWSEDKWTYWYINGWDYDCGRLSWTRIVKWCSSYNSSKVSYTAYCSSVAKVIPVCGSTNGTCSEWSASSVNWWTWTCTSWSISKTCWTPINPCARTNPPAYCRR